MALTRQEAPVEHPLSGSVTTVNPPWNTVLFLIGDLSSQPISSHLLLSGGGEEGQRGLCGQLGAVCHCLTNAKGQTQGSQEALYHFARPQIFFSTTGFHCLSLSG